MFECNIINFDCLVSFIYGIHLIFSILGIELRCPYKYKVIVLFLLCLVIFHSLSYLNNLISLSKANNILSDSTV